MGGDDVRGHIVGRMLYRRKAVDLLAQRQNDDAAGVLARRPVDAHTARRDPLDLTASFSNAFVFKITPDITESRLLRHGTDGARPERLPGTENDLRVFVGITLVFSGEVQVDIRLLVSLESQERFKGDVEPVLFQRCAAHRTRFIRHITAGTAAKGFDLLGIKIAVVAGGAVIMRA